MRSSSNMELSLSLFLSLSLSIYIYICIYIYSHIGSFLLIHIFVNELAMNYIIKLSITFLSGILLESNFNPLKKKEKEREKRQIGVRIAIDWAPLVRGQQAGRSGVSKWRKYAANVRHILISLLSSRRKQATSAIFSPLLYINLKTGFF